MNTVLDTNVLVSGLINGAGTPGRIVDLLRAGAVRAVVDDRILAEYADVLARPELERWFSPSDRDHVLEFLRFDSVRVLATSVVDGLPDEGDAPFLEVALEADVPLVTGNARHFPKRKRRGVAVETPAEFLSRFAV